MESQKVQNGDIYRDWQGDYHILVIDSSDPTRCRCLHLEDGNYCRFNLTADVGIGWIKVA